MPSREDVKRRARRGKYMLILVKEAIRGLRDPHGSTVNDIIRYMQVINDDDVVRDTANLIPLIWHALNIGINTNQILISSDGHRYKLMHDLDPDFEPREMIAEPEEEEGNDAKPRTATKACKKRKSKKENLVEKSIKKKEKEERKLKKKQAREERKAKARNERMERRMIKKGKEEKRDKKVKEPPPQAVVRKRGKKGERSEKKVQGRRVR